MYRILGAISCAALSFATLTTNTHLHSDQSPSISNLIVNGKLRYMANSNICETTPGVNQKSGFITVGKKCRW